MEVGAITTVPVDPQAFAAAALLVDAFADYNARFADITRRARRRFERRDWRQAGVDARARIDLYGICIRETQGRLDVLLDDRLRSRALWIALRQAYEQQVAALADRELYKTWFNSLSRRHFHTRGVAPELEFVALDREPYTEGSDAAAHQCYRADGDLTLLCERLLADAGFAYADHAGCAARLASQLTARLAGMGVLAIEAIDILQAVFYRERRAYLVGRLRGGHRRHPLVIALVHADDGVRVDALLTARGADIDPVRVRAQLFPRRHRQRRCGGGVRPRAAAAQAAGGAVHRAGPCQAGQDRTIPSRIRPPGDPSAGAAGACRRPARHGDGGVHPARPAGGVQADPRPLRRAEGHHARRGGGEVPAGVPPRSCGSAGRYPGVPSASFSAAPDRSAAA